MRTKLIICASVIALIAPVHAYAQETTAIIRGKVTNQGASAGGASLTLTHIPSGTVSATTAAADGSFQLAGLRAGGPFRLVATKNGASATITDIYTAVGQPFDLSVELAGAEEIVVTARSLSSGASSQDPQTIISASEILNIASVNRDVRQIERRDPFADYDFNNGTISFVGTNTRFNAFTVNGANVNDRFGLNADSSPTRRGPIPLDAIEQVSVSVAPVDISQGSFTGGVVDVTLRAGTNRFQGTGFWSLNTPGLTSKRVGDRPVARQNPSHTYGGSLSGPIIKDKLFFQVTGERTTQGQSVAAGPGDQNFATPIPNLTSAQITQIQNLSNSLYGFNPGDPISQRPEVDEKIVGRIDWNITDRQKLFLTYTNSYDSIVNTASTSTSTSTPSLGLISNAVRITELQRSGQIQLNSDWSSSFSTELRGGYLSSVRGQGPATGEYFPQFTVCLDPSRTTNGLGTANTSTITACTPGVPRLVFGTEINRQVNTFFADTYQASFTGRLKLSNHNIKFLVSYDRYRNRNEILRFGLGAYNFDTIDDFINRNASSLTLQRPVSGDAADAVNDFIDINYTFGLQDSWAITPTFNLTYGGRYDLFDTEGRPTTNVNFINRYGYSNTGTLAGRGIFQPRIGFDWKPSKRLKLRGTGGIYAGVPPTVYLENSFAQTGVLTNTVNVNLNNNQAGANRYTNGILNAVGDAALRGVTGATFNPTLLNFLQTNTGSLQAAETDAIAPDFRIPSVWRATLSADYRLNLGPLGDGWNIGLSYLFNKQRSQVLFEDVRLVQTGTLPDGRPRYGVFPGVQDSGSGDFVIFNTDSGRSHVGVVRVAKSWKNGLSLNGSFTLSDITERSTSSASVALSNYNSSVYADPNVAALGTANNERKWQFKYGAQYEHAFFGDYLTTISLYGESKAGNPYSFTFQDNSGQTRSPVFGTIGSNSRYLLYVPTGLDDPRVSYDNATTQAQLEALISSTALKNYRGQIAAKNIGRGRASNRLDLHVAQQIPTFVGGSRVTLYGDIENVLNLIDPSLGILNTQGSALAVVRVACLSQPVTTGTSAATGVTNQTSLPCAQYRYSQFIQPNEAGISVGGSLYTIRLGVRISF
ncbi:MAG: carboxypeptidase regulatory-like domain-containing protein [Sphingomonas sp.]|jgi:hypothetical protein